MTPRQEAFVREYCKDLHGTKAGIRAGYNKKSARIQASYLLANPNIKAAVKARMERKFEKIDLKAEDIARRLKQFAFADLTGVIEVRGGAVYITETENIPEDQLAAIDEITQTKDGIRIKLSDRIKALELLGRHIAMFTDRQEHSGEVKHVHTMTDDELEKVAAGKHDQG